ncbi:MAG TPA: cobalamin-independent methionine synthase II family protein [Xanthobacteraceae bacterium]|jgi:5-methyltetrahydropteroyltriglutamate--homocysteine methyltransferase|nr:cobalamin-independent methionine synthase II family protein [Xanthobacteraceae bacterium]
MSNQERILTTHCGSLPRPAALSAMLLQQEAGQAVDAQALRTETANSVAAVVDAQMKAGIDIVSDGEQPRVGFSMYVPLRMKGFGGQAVRPIPRDLEEFPQFLERLRQRRGQRNKIDTPPKAVAEVSYTGIEDAKAEYDLFKNTLGSLNKKPVDTFMTAASPGIIATTMDNEYYDSYENYVFALARELRKEYQLIASYGFQLQLDAPDFGLERARKYKDQTDKEFLDAMELNVEAINRGTEGIPRERIRLHICWGNWEGPHVHDFPLAGLLPLLYRAKVGALSIEFANPRHQHEYEALRKNPLPADMTLIPGVIDTTTNFVEHPEVVANRICEAVKVVGDKERVIAGTDCGFGTSAGASAVSPDVVWAKLAACRDGADIATKRLNS